MRKGIPSSERSASNAQPKSVAHRKPSIRRIRLASYTRPILVGSRHPRLEQSAGASGKWRSMTSEAGRVGASALDGTKEVGADKTKISKPRARAWSRATTCAPAASSTVNSWPSDWAQTARAGYRPPLERSARYEVTRSSARIGGSGCGKALQRRAWSLGRCSAAQEVPKSVEPHRGEVCLLTDVLRDHQRRRRGEDETIVTRRNRCLQQIERPGHIGVDKG